MKDHKSTSILSLTAPLTDETCELLAAGDSILLSGTVFTARDAAHRRLHEAALRGDILPIDLYGQVIFYAAPTPAPPGRVIGSIGPTTSYRMDPFTPKLLMLGLKGMIGKGKRSVEVINAMKHCHAVYFGAIGGVAALMSQCIRKAEVVAFHDLGPEAIMKLELVDLPLVVINDIHGGDLFKQTLSGPSFSCSE
ncbi:MAG: FumA C-terminus/TtdB family hydratase beta subunit [Syntrophales bacterium]